MGHQTERCATETHSARYSSHHRAIGKRLQRTHQPPLEVRVLLEVAFALLAGHVGRHSGHFRRERVRAGQQNVQIEALRA